MEQNAGNSAAARLPLRGTYHWWFFSAFYFMAVIWGVRYVYYWQPSALDLLFRGTMAITLAWWAIADSIARGRPIPLLSQGWFVILSGLAVPGYVIWSRGWRGVGLLLLHSIAWYAVGATAMIIARVVTFGAN